MRRYMRPHTALLLTAAILALFTAPSAQAQDESAGEALAHRGFMIDMARMKEADQSYFDLVDLLAETGYNALYLHFTDDEGLTVHLESHPKLVSEFAMSQHVLQRLIEHARAKGIEVIPEIEAWGHAGWILDHYPELADETDTRTLAMGDERVYALLDSIIGETSALFATSSYLHIGMDEAWYPAVPDSSPELDSLIAEHVSRVADMVRRRGKTPMMWADMVTGRPLVLNRLPKDIVMIDWRYWIDETDAETRALVDAGFRVITGPAIMWYETRVHPGPHNWENVRRMTRIAHEKGLMGSVVTAWLPQRHPPGVLAHAVAYSGELMRRPEAPHLPDALQRFTDSYFGSSDAELVSAFVRLAGVESTRADLFATFWSDPESFAARLSADSRARDVAYLLRVRDLGETFRRSEHAVKRNQEAYGAYILLGDLLHYLGARRVLPAAVCYALAEAEAEVERGNGGMAADRLRTMAEEVRSLDAMRLRLIERLDEQWDRHRIAEHPLKHSGGPNSLMWWLKDDTHHAFAREVLLSEAAASAWCHQ